jgi:hypothetical protein
MRIGGAGIVTPPRPHGSTRSLTHTAKQPIGHSPDVVPRGASVVLTKLKHTVYDDRPLQPHSVSVKPVLRPGRRRPLRADEQVSVEAFV